MCNIWLPVISWADLFYHTVENLASCSSGFSLQQVITRFLSLPLCFTETVLHGNRRRWALRRRYSPCLRLRGRRLHSRLRRMLQWLRRQRWPRLPKHPRTEIQNPSRCLHKVMNNGAQEEWCLRLTVQEAEWLGCPWTWMTKTERAGGDRVMPCFAFFFVSFFFCLYFSCCFLVKKVFCTENCVDEICCTYFVVWIECHLPIDSCFFPLIHLSASWWAGFAGS